MEGQNLVPKPCDWCSRGGVVGDGNGWFRDSDVDFSSRGYSGIPVCGGCGGLGVQYDTPDFAQRTKRIMELRFEFHPTDALPDPPEILLYLTLKELIKEVRDLVAKYPTENKSCYAQVISDGRLDKVLELLKVEVDAMVDTLENDEPPPEAVEMLPALKAVYSGEVDKGLEYMLKILENNPNDSLYVHDYGILLLRFKRDAEGALAQFIKATELEPKKTNHFFDVIRLLSSLGRNAEAEEYLEKAKTAPDYKDVVTELIGE